MYEMIPEYLISEHFFPIL